jgi:hypothetical protein
VPPVARGAGFGGRGPPGLVPVDAPASQAEAGGDEGDRAGGGGDDAEDGGQAEQAAVMPEAYRPSRATATVLPATSTARPLVVT